MKKWFCIVSPGLKLIQVLAMAAPFMLALSFVAVALYHTMIPMSWLIGAALWPVSVFFYRWKAFTVGAIGVGSLFLGNYPEGLSGMYATFLYASFACSSFLVILTQDHNGTLFGQLEKKALESQDLIENLKGALSEMEFSYEQLRQKSSEDREALEEKYQKKMEEQVNLWKIDKQRLQVLTEEHKEEVEKKDKQLTFVKSIIRDYVSEKMTTPDLFDLPKEEASLSLKSQYKQLKEQFEEKAQALRESRKELFIVETKLFSLQKENELKELDVSGSEITLIHQMINLEQEKEELELQIKHLEELVTELLELKSHAMLT